MKLNSNFLLAYSFIATVLIVLLGVENLRYKNRGFIGSPEQGPSRVTLPDYLENTVPHLGYKNAPIEILLFSSFGCRPCDRQNLYLERLWERNQDLVRISFVFVHTRESPSGLAGAAYAAFKQGKFPEFLVYTSTGNQGVDPQYRRVCEEIGCNVDQFAKQLNSSQTASAIHEMANFAQRSHIEQLPMMFVNGQKVNGQAGATAGSFFASLGLIPPDFEVK